jgi:RNA polymerase sigma-70 factor (ECF subfamily)
LESEEQPPTLRVMDFGAFYRGTWDVVYRAVAVVLGDHDLAREATDEAMVRAFEQWPHVASYRNPEGWAYRVAVNWARNRLRRRWRELPWQRVDATWEMKTPDPDLMKAIATLPIRQRQVVTLRFLFDLPIDAVAEALDIPIGTVKSRLSRAIGQLREVMS